MPNDRVDKDERFIAVERSSVYFAYWVLNFGILADSIYRNLALHQATWDLLGMIAVANLVALVYQARFKILSRTNFWVGVLVTLLAVIWTVTALALHLMG